MNDSSQPTEFDLRVERAVARLQARGEVSASSDEISNELRRMDHEEGLAKAAPPGAQAKPKYRSSGGPSRVSSVTPEVSPDGRFYWDGERWVPMPEVPPVALPNRTSAGLVIAGAAIAVIGSFLPWISATAFFGTVARNGISSSDGQVVVGVAALSALLGVLMWSRRTSLVVPIVLLIAAAIASWIIVVDYQDVSRRVQSVSSTSVIVEVGIGMYLTGVGVVFWTIGALAGFRHRQ